ncbi:MAG: rod shape-determining protein MreD [Ignavibacteriales bacterium]|nr:rod shape-determining protein MreD [Ignavibacteriales bacterium]
MQRYINYGVITLALLIIQTTIVPFTAIANIIPDLLTVWIVYLAIQLGQIPGTVAGFLIGVALDLVGGQFLGLHALSKTVGGFLAGYFFNENKIAHILGSYEFPLVTGITSFVHNIIYFIILVQGGNISLVTAIFRFGLFSTLYTIAVALIPVLVYSRKAT